MKELTIEIWEGDIRDLKKEILKDSSKIKFKDQIVAKSKKTSNKSQLPEVTFMSGDNGDLLKTAISIKKYLELLPEALIRINGKEMLSKKDSLEHIKETIYEKLGREK